MYKGMSRKRLAYLANISYSTISNGFDRNSMPQADVAVRVAKSLNTTVESLMGDSAGEVHTPDGTSSEERELRSSLEDFYRNKDVLDALNNMTAVERDAIKEMILRIGGVDDQHRHINYKFLNKHK